MPLRATTERIHKAQVTPGARQFPAWGGFAVLAGWAAVAIIVGLLLFRTRDA